MDENRIKNLQVLQDKSEDLAKRIKAAVKLELNYWDQRSDPPNLSEAEFKMVLANIPGNYRVRYEPRKSNDGPYGSTGEPSVFCVEFKIPFGRFEVEYFMKGYFFNEGDLKGVCIQSFREIRRVARGKFRVRLI